MRLITFYFQWVPSVTQHRFSTHGTYNGKAIIPLDEVGRDFFSHLTLLKFLRKLSSGDIALPLMRIETRQKCAKDVYLQNPDGRLELECSCRARHCANEQTKRHVCVIAARQKLP